MSRRLDGFTSKLLFHKNFQVTMIRYIIAIQSCILYWWWYMTFVFGTNYEPMTQSLDYKVAQWKWGWGAQMSSDHLSDYGNCIFIRRKSTRKPSVGQISHKSHGYVTWKLLNWYIYIYNRNTLWLRDAVRQTSRGKSAAGGGLVDHIK